MNAVSNIAAVPLLNWRGWWKGLGSLAAFADYYSEAEYLHDRLRCVEATLGVLQSEIDVLRRGSRKDGDDRPAFAHRPGTTSDGLQETRREPHIEKCSTLNGSWRSAIVVQADT